MRNKLKKNDETKAKAPKVKYSFLRILTGSDLSKRRLPLMMVDSEVPGPVVWVTGCVHGDEVGGIVVIQELFKLLKKSPLLCGSVYSFPMMNPIGFETVSRHIGISKEDLNRSFPGNPQGSIAERMANTIFSTIIETKPDLVIDLHNDWIKSIPYALIDPYPGRNNRNAYFRTLQFAKNCGFVVINEKEDDNDIDILTKTISGSLLHHNIPAITLELGEAYVVNETNVSDGLTAILNILTYLNMISPQERKMSYQLHPDIAGKILDYSHKPAASTSGIIRFLVKPGQIINKGYKIAKIYNVYGKLVETVCSRFKGVVLGHSDSSVAMPGGHVAAFGILNPSENLTYENKKQK